MKGLYMLDCSVHLAIVQGHTSLSLNSGECTKLFVSEHCNCTSMSSNLIKTFRGAFMNNIFMFSRLQSQLCLYHLFRVAVQTGRINNQQSLNMGCHCGQFTWFSQHLEMVFLTSFTQVFSLPCQFLEGKNNFNNFILV